MTSRLSAPSVVSMKSQKIMEDIAKKSAMKYFHLFTYYFLWACLIFSLKTEQKIFFCIHKIYEKIYVFLSIFIFNEYFLLSLFLLSLKINRMYKLTGLFDDEDIRMAWNAFR